MALFVPVVIDRSNYFGIALSIVVLKPLYLRTYFSTVLLGFCN